MDSRRKGIVSQTAVLNRLVELGLEVLLPWEPYLRYDLAYYVTEEQRHFGFFVHRESRLVRIQVKTGRLKPDGGSFIFDTQSIHHKNRTENVRRGYVGSAEYFAVYLPDNGKVYMIAINQAPKSDMELHFKSAGVNFGGRHGRISHYTYEEALAMQFTVYWAEDYLRHEAAWVAVETEYSVLNLVFCHQSPTKTCVRSDPEVGQLLGQCTSPGRDQPIHEETLELQASRRLEG